jgi:5'-nucleotidase
MSEQRPLILLTNDDGIHAEGLRHLKMAADRIGEAWIVAPESEQSAVGHSITLYYPIRAHEITKNGSFYGYGIGGTPADSVKLGLYSLLPRRPDLVMSGINNGANLGINVLYSGTVSAATEAAILGIPAMAVSVDRKKNPPFEWVLPHVEAIAGWILKNGLPQGVALNVNVPAIPPDQVRGFKITRQGLAKVRESFEERDDPRGDRYYWLSGEPTARDATDGVDITAVAAGYVSITPLFYDLTAHACTDELECALKNL